MKAYAQNCVVKIKDEDKVEVGEFLYAYDDGNMFSEVRYDTSLFNTVANRDNSACWLYAKDRNQGEALHLT